MSRGGQDESRLSELIDKVSQQKEVNEKKLTYFIRIVVFGRNAKVAHKCHLDIIIISPVF